MSDFKEKEHFGKNSELSLTRGMIPVLLSIMESSETRDWFRRNPLQNVEISRELLPRMTDYCQQVIGWINQYPKLVGALDAEVDSMFGVVGGQDIPEEKYQLHPAFERIGVHNSGARGVNYVVKAGSEPRQFISDNQIGKVGMVVQDVVVQGVSRTIEPAEGTSTRIKVSPLEVTFADAGNVSEIYQRDRIDLHRIGEYEVFTGFE